MMQTMPNKPHSSVSIRSVIQMFAEYFGIPRHGLHCVCFGWVLLLCPWTIIWTTNNKGIIDFSHRFQLLYLNGNEFSDTNDRSAWKTVSEKAYTWMIFPS